MTRRFVRRQYDVAQVNGVAIVQRAVDVSRRKARQPGKIAGAARLGNSDVAVHNHQFRASLFEDGCCAREMVEVCLTA